MSFVGKVVLISGASSGIGAGAARHLAKLGANVSIVGRNQQRLNAVAEDIKSSGFPESLPIIADVTKDTDRIVAETIEKYGKLDVLVNNAGFSIRDRIFKTDASIFDRLFETNVRSVMNLTKLCVPCLEKTKGNIVNVSSVSGMIPLRMNMTYCMSKAALDQFTKCTALDLAPKGIRVSSINPSIIRTNVFETMGISSEEYEESLKSLSPRHPVGRIGEVSDSNAAIAYLADNKIASFISGINLPKRCVPYLEYEFYTWFNQSSLSTTISKFLLDVIAL